MCLYEKFSTRIVKWADLEMNTLGHRLSASRFTHCFPDQFESRPVAPAPLTSPVFATTLDLPAEAGASHANARS